MLVVETIAKIRRAYFVQGKPIKEICRELKVSRKVGAQGAAVWGDGVPLRARGAAAAEDRAVARTSSTGCLRRTTAKAARERLTLIRIFEELRGLGYEGGYDAVRRYATTLAQRSAAQSIG